jgi:hypothetical protein
VPHQRQHSAPLSAMATVVDCQFLRLEVVFDKWHFVVALDLEPATGELREFAVAVACAAGVGRDLVLSAVVTAIAQPVEKWEAAA